MAVNRSESEQINAVLGVLDDVLGEQIAGVYLYGSAVEGGLRTNSDLDLLAVVGQATTGDQRLELVRRLRPLSRRGERPHGWRPVELTVGARAALNPLGLPPRTDFQYGEWLRDELDAGQVDPPDPENPDLLILLAQVSRTGRALRGPQPRELIASVPPADLRSAMLGSIDSLLADLQTDTTNVLLTLARIWVTLETGEFVPKDAAALWAADKLQGPARSALKHAAAVYRGQEMEGWQQHGVDSAATQLTEAIRRG